MLVISVAVSVGGQLVPIAISGGTIPWNLLSKGALPLVMTTFFEEFLFRGFAQNRLEKDYGVFPAILISGLMFSLYHVGYPGFRTFGDILLLFVVGVGFAIVYKFSGNESFFRNSKHCYVVYNHYSFLWCLENPQKYCLVYKRACNQHCKLYYRKQCCGKTDCEGVRD